MFDLRNTLRSLTMTPAATALDQAHKMAQRRLADGRAAASSRGAGNDEPADLVLPADVDALAVAKAVRAKLGIAADAGDDALHPLERKLGGRVVLRRKHLLRLGDGRFDLGRAFMHRVIAAGRAHSGRRPR